MANAGVLVRAYGDFWDPELVQWGKRRRGNKGTLTGRVGQKIVFSAD